MSISVKKISKKRFEELSHEVVFQNENSTQFALVESEGISYCVSWFSDLINLDIREINDHFFAIGADLFFAIVGIKTWNVIACQHLDRSCRLRHVPRYFE